MKTRLSNRLALAAIAFGVLILVALFLSTSTKPSTRSLEQTCRDRIATIDGRVRLAWYRSNAIPANLSAIGLKPMHLRCPITRKGYVLIAANTHNTETKWVIMDSAPHNGFVVLVSDWSEPQFLKEKDVAVLLKSLGCDMPEAVQ